MSSEPPSRGGPAAPLRRRAGEQAPDGMDAHPEPAADDPFERAADILATCLELEPGLRADALAAATPGDPELRELVSQLLNAAELGDTFLDSAHPGPPAREVVAALGDPAAARAFDDHVAGYEIVGELGAGGFGTVWLAQQVEPVWREVALKVLKGSMTRRDAVLRFEHERQLLARMSHGNVARVLESGLTRSGRPFFAMELVRGRPITRHCDGNRLDVRDRLRLYVEACRGVQHAHDRGILHCDIKPSNVMVTDGSRPAPKVIDFGIARATAGDQDDADGRMRRDDVVGTPAYMSPEQATPGAAVDVRTDVYSLGVLLYELLSGVHPFDGAGQSPMVGSLGQAEPPPPSAAVRAQDAASDDVRHELSGNLDRIVMQAMSKRPDARHPTVAALVLDIQRHLSREPTRRREAR